MEEKMATKLAWPVFKACRIKVMPITMDTVALKAKLAELSAQLGPYPHGGLHISIRLSKRSPRPRAKCKSCGFEVPMYKKFLAFGPPLCPKHKTEMEPLGDWE